MREPARELLHLHSLFSQSSVTWAMLAPAPESAPMLSSHIEHRLEKGIQTVSHSSEQVSGVPRSQPP